MESLGGRATGHRVAHDEALAGPARSDPSETLRLHLYGALGAVAVAAAAGRPVAVGLLAVVLQAGPESFDEAGSP